jgi:trk system potassium uptake protein TrkH
MPMILRQSRLLRQLQLHPTETVAASFVIAALIGALLLRLPWASHGEPVSWVNAIFTATSAVCVTGLTVVDTGATYTTFGHVVILSLIQAGGLGIMTFSVILILFSGRRISLYGRAITEQTFTPQPERQIYHLLRTIVGATLAIEAIGALLLYWFVPDKGMFPAVFHAISAFCNAGFSLFPDNLTQYRDHLGVNLVITCLIIVGGLGFYVVFECLRYRPWRRTSRLSLHSKMVLSVTAGLILAGTVAIYFLEADNLLKGLPFGQRLLASYFQAVTPRTAGFNTLDLSQATFATLLFLIVLMFVGASPGSTGGGVKTTTLGVMIALAKNKLRGREQVDLFKTSISDKNVARALSVTILASGIILGAVFVLLCWETGSRPYHQTSRHFIEFFFETTSAFGTVGLSTGLTAHLTSLSKMLLCGVMLLGRIGPLTVAHAVGRRYGRGKFRYAEEGVMIG